MTNRRAFIIICLVGECESFFKEVSMVVQGVGSGGVPQGLPGPNSEILASVPAPAGTVSVAEMARGLAGMTGDLALSRSSLWGTTPGRVGASSAQARPQFLENLSHLRETFQLGGMNQGIKALARAD